jgi:regulator of RNase E activity RraA
MGVGAGTAAVDEAQPADAPWATPIPDERRRALERIGAAALSAQLRKHGIDHHVIGSPTAAAPDKKLVVIARTLRYLPLREDVFQRIGNGYNAQKRAVDLLSEGQVLVIDSRGDRDADTIGDLLVKTAIKRGAAGVIPRELAAGVIDGAQQQDLEEVYIGTWIEAGDSLNGLYPLGQEARVDFDSWAGERRAVHADSPDRTGGGSC